MSQHNNIIENADLPHSTPDRTFLATRLQQGLSENQYFLHYQPIVIADSGHIVGAEAFLRLRESGSASILPSVLIPALENSGLISDVGRWAISQACQQIREWHSVGAQDMYVSVNITLRQFEDVEFTDFIYRCLDNYGIPPCALHLEIPEGVLMGNPKRSYQLLDRLRDGGIHTVVDNFGSDCNAIRSLAELPVSGIKLDKKFLSRKTQNEDRMEAAISIINYSRQKGLWQIAGGIEHESQRRFMQSQGIEMMQGILFGRPMPSENILTTISQKYFRPDTNCPIKSEY